MRLESFKYIKTSFVLIGVITNAYAQGLTNVEFTNDNSNYDILFNVASDLDNDASYTGNISQTLSVSSTNYISETEIPLTIEEHKDIAITAIKSGLINTAEKHLKEIKDEYGEYSFNQYATALNLSNQGNFTESLQIMNELSLDKSSFQGPAKEFADKLKITLAEQAFSTNNYDETQYYIDMYTSYNPNRKQLKHIERLKQKLNIKMLKSSGFEPQKGTPLKIALLIPLTGKNKEIGQQLLAAAQLSLFNTPNPNILLYPHDTKSTKIGAAQAAKKAISDRSHVILGPLTAENTRAIFPYTLSANIPIISFSSDSSIARHNTALLSYAPEEQAESIAKYAADKGIKTVAILAPDSIYGNKMIDKFKESIVNYDISLTDIAIFDENSPDQTKELKQLAQIKLAKEVLNEEFLELKNEYKLVGEAMDDTSLARLEELKTAEPQPIIEFDALYLPVSAEKLPLIASQLAYYNMDAENITLLGTARWQNQSIHKNRAEYIRGAFFPAPPRKAIGKAYKHFYQTYNKEAHPLTIVAYDGITLLSKLYEESKNSPHLIMGLLYRDEGHSLNGGLLRFNHNGIPNRLYSIYEVRSYTSVERETAPSQFPPILPENIDPRNNEGFGSFFNPWNF